MDDFEVPEDLSALSNDELSALHDAATAAFQALRESETITEDELVTMRGLAEAASQIRDEQGTREAAAEAAAAEIESLAAQMSGEVPEVIALTDPAEGVTAPEAPPEGGEPAATASGTPRRAFDLSGVRSRQPRVLPKTNGGRGGTTFSAAVDVPGHKAGAAVDLDIVNEGFTARANALKAANGGTSLVTTYQHPFAKSQIVVDPGSPYQGSTVTLAASNQRNLPQRDLVASGGWCAPSETLYDIVDIACPDMLWDVPEIQLARGGIRYFKTPSLDVAALTWVHTEADDIAGNEKPCYKVPCPDPLEVRCGAVGVCLESGILTQKFFPELTSWYVRNSMVAHEIRVKQVLFAQALAGATAVVLAPTFAALSAIYSAVALQAADMIERHSFCDTISLEVVFPWWTKNLFLTDMARRNGVSLDQVSESDIQDLFTNLGVRVQWARGLAPGVPTDIGGAVAAVDWPSAINFLIYPAGQLQVGRGADVDLGVIHDSSKFVTNDYTAVFTEECVALVDKSVDTRRVTVPVCPSGATGAQTALVCPAP